MRLTVPKLFVTLLLILSSLGQVSTLAGEHGQEIEREGLLEGTFLQLTLESATWEESRWKEFFGSMVELQMSQLIVQWTVYDGKAFYPSEEMETVDNAPLTTILDLADSAGVDVWLGLAHDSDYWEKIQRDPPLVEVYLQKRKVLSRTVAAELVELLADHKSFKGWYLIEEIDDRTWLPRSARRILLLHLKQVERFLQEMSPEKPVAISGFSSGYSEPHVLGSFWDEVLSNVSIDLLLLQDGIGVGKLDLYTLPLYLASLRDVIARHETEMRVVIELFEQTSQWDEPFAAQSAEPGRVFRQLDLASKFTTASPIAFSILEYMTPFGEKRARELYRRYLAESKSR